MPWHSLPTKIPLYQVNLNFYVATQEENFQKFRGLCCLPAVARVRLSAVLTKKIGSQSLLICFEGLPPQPRPLCVVRRLGRGKKEIVRADDGKGKETRLLAIFRFLLFSLVYPALASVEERVYEGCKLRESNAGRKRAEKDEGTVSSLFI